MFFKQTFKIFFDDGKIVETSDLLNWISTNFYGGVQEFYYRMKWLCNYEKTPFWNYHYYNKYNDTILHRSFYLYTENNMMISPELFKGEYKSHNEKHFDRSYIYPYSLAWRCNRGGKSHSTTYDRRMETMAERRAIAGVVKEEGEPEFRGRRRCIPNPWDDIITRRSLSWKDCTKRKRQHKGS
jgi:hypothetical protein